MSFSVDFTYDSARDDGLEIRVVFFVKDGGGCTVGLVGRVLADALRPVLRLQLHALLDRVEQGRVRVRLAELGQHALLVRLVLVARRVDLGDEHVEVGIGPQRALRHQLLAACRAFLNQPIVTFELGSQTAVGGGKVSGGNLVARAEGCDDAVGTKTVQAFFGGHRVLQHVQADGAHQLAVQAPR